MYVGDCLSFYDCFNQNKEKFDSDELKVVEKKLAPFLSQDNLEDTTQKLLELTYKEHEKTIETGFSEFNPHKLFHMILYFSRNGVLKTKLMKLLWYADFLGYKRFKRPISGTPYWHLTYGPVPKKHELVLGSLIGMDLISTSEEENGEGYTRIIIKAIEKFDSNIFANDEWDIIRYVDEYFKDYGSRAISNFAHDEAAWKETQDEQIIPYEYAGSLQLD